VSVSTIDLTKRAVRYGSITPGDFAKGATSLTTIGSLTKVTGAGTIGLASVADILLQLTGAATLAAGAMLYGAGTATPSTLTLGTAGQVLVAGASAPAWTDTFTTAKTIDLGSGALPAAIGTPNLILSNADAAANRIQVASFGVTTCFAFDGRNIGGTRAANAATSANARFFSFGGFGHNGSALVNTSQATFYAYAPTLWSGTNYETAFIFSGTSNGATSAATWMTLQNAALGIGAAPTTGNGLLQLASGTTKANGIAFGADTFLYRSAGGVITNLSGVFRVEGTAHTTCRYSLSRTDGSYTGGDFHFGLSDLQQGLSFRNASSTTDLMVVHANGIGFGSYAPVSGNGRIQIQSGTTKADGIAFGTDTFLYRHGTAGIWVTGESTLPTALGGISTTGAMAIQRAAAAANLYFQRCQGSFASPTQVTTGQGLGNFYFGGYHSGGAYNNTAGQFSFSAAEAWTGSANGSEFSVLLTPIGATAISTNYTFRCTAPAAGDCRVGINISGAPAYTLDVGGSVNVSSGSVYRVNATQVVGAQGAAVADATDAASVIARLNDLLSRCRAHGLIAP
jgi:trimeric autotransporter adhesin